MLWCLPCLQATSATYAAAAAYVGVLDTRLDELLVAFQDYFSAEIDENNSISIVLFVLGTLSIPVLWFWLLRPVFNKVSLPSSFYRILLVGISMD